MSGLSQFKSSEDLQQMDKEEQKAKKDETYNIDGTFSPKKFFSLNPTLEDFKALDQLQFLQCLDFDRKQFWIYRFIYSVEKLKENNPLIIYLLENGFNSYCHPDDILKNNNLPLLKYFYENNIFLELNQIYYVIKNNNMEILEYILETNMIQMDIYKLRYALKDCINFNRMDMLELLSFRYKSLFEQVLKVCLK
jgi:hypothetical protein